MQCNSQRLFTSIVSIEMKGSLAHPRYEFQIPNRGDRSCSLVEYITYSMHAITLIPKYAFRAPLTFIILVSVGNRPRKFLVIVFCLPGNLFRNDRVHY